MVGFLPMLDLTRHEIKLADEACFKYTGDKGIVKMKHTLSYIFFFVPQAIFLVFFYPVNLIFFKFWGNLRFLRIASELVKGFADLFEIPSWITVWYYSRKRGVPEDILLRMWKNPFVTYSAVFYYRKEKGLEDPPYPCVE
jgi:hypothetical protein